MTQPRIEPVALSLEKRLWQEFLCQFGSMDAVIGFARKNMGAADSALQDRVLTVGEGEDAYRFAREVHGADRAACQARVLVVGTAWDTYCFSNDIPGADVAALYERAKSLSFSGLSANSQFKFDRLLVKYRHCLIHPERQDDKAAVPTTLTEQQAAEQDRILHEGAAIDAYSFAKNMPGADRKALEARVLSIGSATDIYLFARDVPGSDVGACQTRVQALCKTNCRVLYWFAKNIKSADIFTLHQQANEMGFGVLDKNQRADFKTLLALWAAEAEMASKLAIQDSAAAEFHSPN